MPKDGVGDVSQLAKVYYDPSQPEGYAGASRLAKKFPKVNVKKWLATQPAYTLHKPLRRKFTTRKYLTSGPDELWQMDLMEMIPYATINAGNRYILTCIDVFSRFARAIAVKSKDAKTVADAVKKIMVKSPIPRHVQTDLGKEFYNKIVQDLFRKLKINHYTVHSQFKAAVVERFNRTLRERLNRYFTYQRNKKWLAVLPKIVDAYNHASHRSLKGKRPIDVYTDHNLDDWVAQQPTKTKISQKLLQVGSLVRISRISTSSPFRKNFDQNWSEEIFRIASVETSNKPVMYTLKDVFNDEIVQGKFYKEELQDVGDTLPSVYRIEKVIATKGKGAHKQYLVKWYGHDKSRNSWITKDQFVK
jgi:L-rhamnose mutarotase